MALIFIVHNNPVLYSDPSGLTTRRGLCVFLTQNPKTGTEEIRGKLGQESGRGDEDDAQGGDQPSDVLSLEACCTVTFGYRARTC
jgi:hypothetical protein